MSRPPEWLRRRCTTVRFSRSDTATVPLAIAVVDHREVAIHAAQRAVAAEAAWAIASAAVDTNPTAAVILAADHAVRSAAVAF